MGLRSMGRNVRDDHYVARASVERGLYLPVSMTDDSLGKP